MNPDLQRTFTVTINRFGPSLERRTNEPGYSYSIEFVGRKPGDVDTIVDRCESEAALAISVGGSIAGCMGLAVPGCKPTTHVWNAEVLPSHRGRYMDRLHLTCERCGFDGYFTAEDAVP